MSIIFILLFVILFATVAYIDGRLKMRRDVLFNELAIAYDNMELFLVKNKIQPNTYVVEFLKSYKFLLVNKGLADIRVLISIILSMSDQKNKESKESFEKIKENIDPGLLTLSNDFIKVYNHIIGNSIYTFGFIWFVIKSFAYSLFKSKKHVRITIKLTRNKTDNRHRGSRLRTAIVEALHSENILPTSHKWCA